jgi:hypothetical protein
MKYAMWEISEDTLFAYYANENIVIKLENSPFPHGWWPCNVESNESVCVVTGICLFDASWRVQFKALKDGQKGTKRSLALPREREEACKFILRGREIEKIYYPVFPTVYAKKILAFQKWGLEFINSKKRIVEVHYHLPRNEYLAYCNLLPSPWREKMLKVVVEESERVHSLVKESLCEWPLKIHWGRSDPPESFIVHYIRSLVESDIMICGLEDLVELRIPLAASRQTGRLIPVMVGMLGIPHPYFKTSEEDWVELEL